MKKKTTKIKKSLTFDEYQSWLNMSLTITEIKLLRMKGFYVGACWPPKIPKAHIPVHPPIRQL